MESIGVFFFRGGFLEDHHPSFLSPQDLGIVHSPSKWRLFSHGGNDPNDPGSSPGMNPPSSEAELQLHGMLGNLVDKLGRWWLGRWWLNRGKYIILVRGKYTLTHLGGGFKHFFLCSPLGK